MNPQLALTIVGAFYIIQSLGLFFGSGDITAKGFPIELDENALLVGKLLHEAIAGMVASFGVILLFSRQLEADSARIVWLGGAIGMVAMFAVELKHLFTSVATPPIPLMVIQLVCLGLLLFASRKPAA